MFFRLWALAPRTISLSIRRTITVGPGYVNDIAWGWLHGVSWWVYFLARTDWLPPKAICRFWTRQIGEPRGFNKVFIRARWQKVQRQWETPGPGLHPKAEVASQIQHAQECFVLRPSQAFRPRAPLPKTCHPERSEGSNRCVRAANSMLQRTHCAYVCSPLWRCLPTLCSAQLDGGFGFSSCGPRGSGLQHLLRGCNPIFVGWPRFNRRGGLEPAHRLI